MPPRSVTGGVLFKDLWDDVVGQVFGEWVAFTEQEDHKPTSLLWESGVREKIAEVSPSATAFPVRVPHYYLVVTARWVT